MKYPFKNEPATDFAQPENTNAFRAALETVRAELGKTYPLYIGGGAIYTQDTIASTNPSNPAQLIGRVSVATPELAARAVEAAAQAFETWLMRQRKHFVRALMVLEAGKNWVEADYDTGEAIDFMEFYGREMLRLGPAQPTVAQPDREVELFYVPLGVGVVIPPWNFPNAILTGLTSATIVAGNTAVVKPASATPVTGAWIARLFNEELHLPPGVLNFVPGPGGVVGDTLVDHPKTRFVAFTGSKEIGLRIFERAAKTAPGQRWLKRTILEMGGKDAILVDETADLDAAATGIVAAAFGYQGQKCSACSRAIVVADVYDALLAKVVERTQALQVGDPAAGPQVDMGPVIERAALAKYLEYIEAGKAEGRLVCGGQAIPTASGGYFLHPTIFADIPATDRLAQEEIFGPVLAFIRARDFEDGLAIANNTEYGLTGAVYSMRRDRLERARREFHTGNLYFNRKCTGAAVGAEPFGGFNMSGTDSKAGGSDYLLLFTQAKVISELG
jgi:1-pyrroline-5-carboxylate dehydrogenase